MLRSAKYIIFLFALTQSISVLGQSYNFRQLSNTEGLSQSQVLSIEQDNRGFLWIGTAGGGLNRFDGQKFKAYTTYDGLPDDNIWTIFCDSRDRLWLGTSTGLAIYENGKFKTFPSYNGLDDDKIYSIAEDLLGNIWIATANNGVSVYDGTNFKNYAINDGLGFSKCNRVFCQKNGTVWIGSFGYGLTSFKNGKFERMGIKDNFKADYVFDIESRQDGGFYMLTEIGLYEYSQESFSLINPVDFDYTRSSDLITDDKNNIWISTNGLGVYKVGENRTVRFSNANGLPVEDIICLFKDNTGNIWMGTNGSGLFQYHGDAFINYNQLSGLGGNIVRGLAFDGSENILLGTSVGIDKILPNGEVNSFFKDKRYFNCASIFKDSKSVIWASFDNSWGYFTSPGNFTPIKGLPTNVVVNDFYEDHNHTLWLGTNDGLFTLSKQKVARRLRDSIPETTIFGLKKSLYHKNSFWICSSAGLVLYDGKYIRSVKIKKPNENIDVLDLWEDPFKKLWVITNRGLCVVLRNGKKIWINKQDGLSSNNLFSIEYFEESLWIGSDKGIDRIELNDSYELSRIENFGKNKGFLGEEVNSLGCIQDNDKLYFATINGLYIYNPANYTVQRKSPDIYISEIALNYQKINWEKEYPDIRLINGLPQKAEFSYSQNYFTFYFNAIDFNSPENVRIQFMLQGLDTSWINASEERQTTYSNLAPGNYEFKVRATNDNLIWGKSSVFKFSITAPFWRRSWFVILLIPSLLLFGFLMSQWRTRRLRRMQARLKFKIEERTRELRYKNDELEKLSIVASQTNDGVLICDQKGKILFLNDGFKRMTSLSPAEFDKSDYNKAYLQEISSQNNIQEIIDQIIRTGKSVTYESTHTQKDGNIIWTHASLTPIFENMVLDKIIVIYTNITDRVITEHALIQTNKDITDSIHYAKKIQEAILPNRKVLANNYPDSFIFYKPRDIVSGDFYWFTRIKNTFVFACADCTGHGVPGAMMTMIGNEFLHQIINNAMVTSTDVALKLLDKQIIRAMDNESSEKETKDGMDIGLGTINIETLAMQFSGANIPLYVVRNKAIIDFSALKTAIGNPKTADAQYYIHDFVLQKNDVLYMTSDGYVDQLGGEKGRKFMRKIFKELLIEIHELPMEQQEKILNERITTHRGNYPQTDDMLVMGIRI
jgi:PAS domain S-box-containing protein